MTAVQRDVVSDRHLVFQNRRVRAVRDVYDRAVLNVCALAYRYVEHVAAHHSAEPDGGVRADGHVAYDLRAVFHERGRVNLRVLAAERSNHRTHRKGARGRVGRAPLKTKTVARAWAAGKQPGCGFVRR